MIGAAQMLTVRVPLAVRKERGGRKLVLTPGGMTPRGASAADTTLVKALARAFRYQKLLDDGLYASISEMAAAEKIERGYLGSLLRLTLLAPALVEEMMEGTAWPNPTLPELLQPFPEPWEHQREVLAPR